MPLVDFSAHASARLVIMSEAKCNSERCVVGSLGTTAVGCLAALVSHWLLAGGGGGLLDPAANQVAACLSLNRAIFFNACSLIMTFLRFLSFHLPLHSRKNKRYSRHMNFIFCDLAFRYVTYLTNCSKFLAPPCFAGFVLNCTFNQQTENLPYCSGLLFN